MAACRGRGSFAGGGARKVVPWGVEIFVATDPVDLRLGIERLGGLVPERMGPGRALIVFVGRRRQSLQVLGWDGTGRVLWTKRLDRGVFELPTARAGSKSVELSEAAFVALFHGLRRTPIH